MYKLFLFYLSATKTHPKTFRTLLIPESRKMAKTYCSALCNLSGMCEFFMTTDDSKCPHGCNTKHDKRECILFAIIIVYFTFKIN